MALVAHGWTKDSSIEELLRELNVAYKELSDVQGRVNAIRGEIYWRRHSEYIARAQELDRSLSIDINEYIQVTKPVCPDCHSFVTDANSHSIVMSSGSPVLEFRCGRNFGF